MGYQPKLQFTFLGMGVIKNVQEHEPVTNDKERPIQM